MFFIEFLEKRGDRPLRDVLAKTGGWPVLDKDWDAAKFDWVDQLIKFRKLGKKELNFGQFILKTLNMFIIVNFYSNSSVFISLELINYFNPILNLISGLTHDMIFDLSVSQDYKNNTIRKIEVGIFGSR